MGKREEIREFFKNVGFATKEHLEVLGGFSIHTLNKILPKVSITIEEYEKLKEQNKTTTKWLLKISGNYKEKEKDIYFFTPYSLQTIGGKDTNYNFYDFEKISYCIKKVIEYKKIVNKYLGDEISFAEMFRDHIYTNYFKIKIKKEHDLFGDADVVLDIDNFDTGKREIRVFMYVSDLLDMEEERLDKIVNITQQIKNMDPNILVQLQIDSYSYLNKSHIKDLKERKERMIQERMIGNG